MSRNPAYPWRSALGHRVFATLTDGRERAAFTRMVALHRIGEAELRAPVRAWVAGRARRSSAFWPGPGG
jgi:hypothetical protein